jgi:hypothetical protein
MKDYYALVWKNKNIRVRKCRQPDSQSGAWGQRKPDYKAEKLGYKFKKRM